MTDLSGGEWAKRAKMTIGSTPIDAFTIPIILTKTEISVSTENNLNQPVPILFLLNFHLSNNNNNKRRVVH